MNKEMLLAKKRTLKEQLDILVNSTVDYLEQAKFQLKEAQKLQRINLEKLDEEKLNGIEEVFNSLKNIFVFGDLEEKMPELISEVRELLPQEKENENS